MSVHCVVHAVMLELTEVQNLSDGSKTQTREHELKEAQFYDDKALLEELRATIKSVISKDSIKYVPMCHEFFVI
jgi:hypothetical protein